ncbi:MAG: DUF2024 family protein [Saprospiraceae bacterium]|jgi:hypothetical protein|nr:DUF2024 family protein [Saprospiraceae bacterium]
MPVSVFDTYIRKPDGSTAHFDIIVPEGTDVAQVLAYGQLYLAETGIAGAVSMKECQFCHIEEPAKEMLSDIEARGFFILPFDDIPADLPENPTRRQLIEHLRAHSEAHRFANFRGVGEEEIRALLAQVTA